MLLATIRRSMRVTFRQPSEFLNPLFFFVLVIALFPLGVGPSEKTLALIAPGVIWVAALLATLLSMESLFRSDFDDGSLDQMSVAPQSMLLMVTGKVIAHWVSSGLPLVLVSPVLGIMLSVDEAGVKAILISLMLGTPILSLLGAVGASLTVGLQKGGVLIALLIIPLYVPVLILGTSLIQTAQLGGDYDGHILWMLALLALTIGTAPIATAGGIKVSLSR
ncbi:MAG: heme exporter protein B [Candidatus Azotimanducaceae bacterium]|jgi:heme exporter protein B